MKTWSGVQLCMIVTLCMTLLPNVVFSQCGGHLTGESGEFKSPNFPENYPDNAECTWEITVPEGKTVDLKFHSFNLEPHSNCYYDKVEIYDGADANARKIGPFCGTDRPADFTSSGNKLYVKLTTDGSGTEKGFEARFRANGPPPCESILTGESGEFKSPNFPGNYPSNAECTWTITVPEHQQVSLQFQSLDIDCAGDFIEVHDGSDGSARKIGHFCGTADSTRFNLGFNSTGNQMHVKLTTDGSNQQEGFEARFNAIETAAVTRILVVTGWQASQKKTEVWPKPESQCTLPDFPLEVYGAVAFWTAQGPMVCGGDGGGNKCFLYKNHQWMPSTTMGTARWYASAVQIDPNQAIIIGGRDGNNALKSTEVKTSTGSEEGKDFPTTIVAHCSFKINSTHALVTGGFQDYSRSASTWFVDLTTTTVTPGPTMTSRRGAHGCATLQLGRKTFGIVAGGKDYPNYLDSTEWIDLEEEIPTWTEGPKLPRGLERLTLVETTQGTYALGGSDGSNTRSEVLHLDCPGNQIQSCQWQEMPEKLEVGRHSHVSLSLPESYDICN